MILTGIKIIAPSDEDIQDIPYPSITEFQTDLGVVCAEVSAWGSLANSNGFLAMQAGDTRVI